MSKDPERTPAVIAWRDSSPFVTTFYAVLTAMVGAILALAIADKEIAAHWYYPVSLLAFSMCSLIWGLEKCGEAVDEDDVDKYLAWLLPYNLGSVAMFFGIATYIALHYHVNRVLLTTILILATFASWKWIYDVWFLLFKGNHGYNAYREELLGKRPPERESDPIVALHRFFRGLHERKGKEPFLPSTNSFTRLRPSPIHGIGVFAIRDIANGTNIFKDDNSKMIWIDEGKVLNQRGEIRRLYDDFCVVDHGKYGCPKGFNNLTVAWYINEPLKGEEPNVICGAEYDFFAAREIREGEELTVDYSTYSDNSESDNPSS